MFLPESDNSVGKKQNEDDGEIQPVPDNARQNHRCFNHPWDGAPEISQEFEERIVFLYRYLVRPVLGKPLCRLGLTEAVRR